MPIAWIDAQVGVAGDMLLAALIDAGARVEVVRAGLAGLGIEGFTLEIREVQRGAFRAAYAEVRVAGDAEEGGPEAEETRSVPRSSPAPTIPKSTVGLRFSAVAPSHDHVHTHADAPAVHDHSHSHGTSAPHAHDHAHGGHVHRPYRRIRELIETGPLPARVRQRALAAYGRLAAAEAKLHGMSIDDVELHEVGATDALVDIIGVCLALEDLRIDRLFATPLPMGTGQITAAHGALALPAPATLEVCRGWPLVAARWPGEWVTPTGAALVTALCDPSPFPTMAPTQIGVGAGRKDPPQVANLVRVVIGEAPAAPLETVTELATNLDDTTGELIAALNERLLQDGALDVWTTPVQMKKGRPGVVVHALCQPIDADRLSAMMLKHSSALGVRRASWQRDVLERWFVTVTTPWGPVRIKVGGKNGVAWHHAPEFADVAAVAAAADVPVATVYAAAIGAWNPRDAS